MEPQVTKFGKMFIEDVDRIDCAYFDPSKGIVGQSWHVDIEVSGKLDLNGFVHDFSKLKSVVKTTLAETIDHSLLIPVLSKQVTYSVHQTNRDMEAWHFGVSKPSQDRFVTWEYHCPKGATYMVHSAAITESVVEQECSRLIRHRLNCDYHDLVIRLREEQAANDAVFFHYTHGITHHNGNCQRLFHGHKSLIEVTIDGARRYDLEKYIAQDLFANSIHIASTKQIDASDHPLPQGSKHPHEEYVTLDYQSTQGRYRSQLPKQEVFLVNTETSIESIAKAIKDHLIRAKDLKGDHLQVKCFEGIGKGAIASERLS